MNNKPTTIKELCEFIWYLEDKYDLLDFECNGVKVWQYTRMKLYYRLAEASGVLSQAHSRLSKLDKVKHLLGYIKNSLMDNYFTLQQKDVVVFSHSRVVDVDGELIDIYTKYFIDELIDADQKILEFESPYLGIHRKNKTNFTHYLDWIALSQRLYSIFLKVVISHDELKTIKKIENEINKICKININLVVFFTKKIKTYKSVYFIYNKIFKKIKPKKLYIVVSYGQSDIIKAAKNNNIEVIELQHGTFSKYHLGYSFPDREKILDYFPDKFYVWNKYWKNLIKLPIDDEYVVIDKFRYLEKQKLKFKHLSKNQNQIVVLSQGAIGNAIAEKFLEHFYRFENYTIKYKLHPGEFDRWKNYPALKELSKFNNVEVLKSEIPLYELFATSSIQVGVFSTALYEGVEFGCETILLNISGIEYMEQFINNIDVKILK